jgi:hypothetical protein
MEEELRAVQPREVRTLHKAAAGKASGFTELPLRIGNKDAMAFH